LHGYSGFLRVFFDFISIAGRRSTEDNRKPYILGSGKNMIQTLSTDNGSSNKFERIVSELADTGFSTCDNFVSPLLVSSMAFEARRRHKQGDFRHARVGNGASMQLRPEIRNDRVLWLDSDKPGATQLPYFLDLETLRREINRNLYLGLFEFEGHFALYPPGASYDIHFDRFIGTMERVVTCILDRKSVV